MTTTESELTAAQIVDQALIDSVPETSGWTRAEVAAAACAFLEQHHPVEFAQWKDETAVSVLTTRLGTIQRTQRAQKLRRNSVFNRAKSEAQAGGSILDLPWVIDDAQSEKFLRDMGKADLKFVAAQYEASAQEDLRMSAFFLAVERRLKKGQTVGDAFTEEQIERMLERARGGVAA